MIVNYTCTCLIHAHFALLSPCVTLDTPSASHMIQIGSLTLGNTACVPHSSEYNDLPKHRPPLNRLSTLVIIFKEETCRLPSYWSAREKVNVLQLHVAFLSTIYNRLFSHSLPILRDPVLSQVPWPMDSPVPQKPLLATFLRILQLENP